jgi:uncharacterized protein YidB (DUF937 family)
MGLLDNVMGKLGGKQGADGGQGGEGGEGGEGGLQALTKLLSANGGVQGLMAKLSSNGLGQQVQSWVGTGENKPVSGGQVSQALDTDSLNKLAAETGTTPEKASENVAKVLPEVVDKATPGGQVPKQGDDPLSKGLDALKGMFANK